MEGVCRMKRFFIIVSLLWILPALCLLMGKSVANENDAVKTAEEILDKTGVKGGIIVHLGYGDGTLTAALRANDSYTVHGLEVDPTKVAEARSYICGQGVYGPVSVELFSGSMLPYKDNLVNLVVVQDAGKVAMNEIMRVLAPGGVAYVEHDGKWNKTVKAWPNNIDQWSHFLHDASNNAVADDTVVGPPRSLQWVEPPLWLRSHETPSGVQASVTAGGRLFYFFDEGLIGITDERLPDRWSLICRDAFNGRLLWKRPLKSWGWRQWDLDRYEGKDWTTLRAARTDVPNENQRRIVADGDKLYTTLSYQAPMSVLDAATGNILATFDETQGTKEILVSDGLVVAYTEGESDAVARRRGIKKEVKATLVAVSVNTQKVIWDKRIGQIRPLSLAIEDGRIVFLSGRELIALDLKDGSELWKVQPEKTSPRTLLIASDTIVMQGGKSVSAYDAADGRLLWQKTVPPIGGGEGDDLFVIDGLVYRGMLSVDEEGKPVSKSPNVLVIGWDLRSGLEKKRILVKNLRSPEHHHRCYRNKATVRYLISSYEGAEFLDFKADNNCQNNWLRGACRYGMMPANGMLYVPPDQCFCQPGAKFLGFAAVKAEQYNTSEAVADQQRLEKGPAYGIVADQQSNPENDWLTFRHDAARSGTTHVSVSANIAVDWKVPLGGKLTAPVAANGRLFLAETDEHTLDALDMTNGKKLWQFIADGRIDSPPTIYRGMVLFGSNDGRVYCLRASDGRLVWRFLAAPIDRRIGCFDQVESAWPVHGSVLVDNGTAYFTAGRSTYLDGGIHFYGLEPASGKILHKGLLEGPHRDVNKDRDLGFFTLGANSDVLVSEGGFIYMRQKKMTPDLKEVKVNVLSSKGAQDVGLHVFSTAGLLDGSWYNRTFWMYSKRWPGFQLANQAPKTGQLLVVDDKKTYAVRTFYRRNVHSPMFFPGREGYLLFADYNTNEPQIVGEAGSREPLRWLPQSDYSRASGNQIRTLESDAFGLDKMIGYTRTEPPVWTNWLDVRIRAMVKAGETLFVAGPPDILDSKDPYAAFEGRDGARLVAISANDGKKLSETPLECSPVFDGMIAANGRLFACLEDGSVVSLAAR
jgi:outer membrane protein assembly factor BamB/SAM-dependent methyltransferase